MQLSEIHLEIEKTDRLERLLFPGISSFLKILSQDEYLQELRSFFNVVVMEIYSIREGDQGRDIPFAIMSFLLDETALQQFAYNTAMNREQFSQRSDLRYDGGGEIVPHRRIESFATQRMN